MNDSSPTLHRQRGLALLVVLWMSLLLTVVAGGFAYNSQVESLLVRRTVDNLRGTEAIKAGLELVVYQLRQQNQILRPWADGRPYEVFFEGIQLTIRVQDESGKFVLNKATGDQLNKLFLSIDLSEEEAVALADAVQDFTDPDSLVRLNGAEADDYIAADLTNTPKNAPFIVLEELLQVYGMDESIYEKIVPALTLYGKHDSPDLRLAPKEVLSTVSTEVTEGFIDEFLQLRYSHTSAAQPLPPWPDGRQLTAFAGNGPFYTVDVIATLPNKNVVRAKAIIRVLSAKGYPPYQVMEWQDGG